MTKHGRRKKRAKHSRKPRSTGARTGGFMTSSSIRRAGAEVKTIDLFPSTVTGVQAYDNTSGPKTAVLLNGMAQGTDFTQHVGRKASMKSLLFRATVYPDKALYDDLLATTPTTNYMGIPWRIIIVYDKQTNGTSAKSTDVINNGSSGRLNVIQAMNLNNRDRFKVLYDKKGIFDVRSKTSFFVEKFIKLKMKEIIFQGTSNGVGDIATGSIILYFLTGCDGSSAINSMYMDFMSRIRVLDS